MATCPINVKNMRAGAKKLGVPLIQGDYADGEGKKLCGVCAITACFAATAKRVPKDIDNLRYAGGKYAYKQLGDYAGSFIEGFDGGAHIPLNDDVKHRQAYELGQRLARAAGFDV